MNASDKDGKPFTQTSTLTAQKTFKSVYTAYFAYVYRTLPLQYGTLRYLKINIIYTINL
ncbi:hypothetical protein Xsto_00835 [Xenorhabdus stockiae]|uniref:Uncharacterized protein n=1 Tax=Xenorhabdus stockiae TaxID=351614 RepID=A0A2D0KTN2_9GAMM|nr:hypothetical protein Xekk_00182 [Xenorhabdus sp. KK7.4]PHM66816.1 hypothetical protein Xsto_00835 [Xenorhabdus stockiae]PHM71027.1 hypothetical protein Xekj_01444 [Xenorhabdus sp. KJ12.1]